jgi:hypothetical protein
MPVDQNCREGTSLAYTDKKNVLIYKEIQTGACAKSYMTNGLLKYD